MNWYKLWHGVHVSTGRNINLTHFIFILIAILIIVTIPLLFNLIFAFSKEKLSKKGTVYLYAFMSGFFITMALFGFLKESLEISSIYAPVNVPKANESKFVIYGWNILIVVGGLILGLFSAWGMRALIKLSVEKKISKDTTAKTFLHVHDFSHENEHDHHSNPENHISPSHEVIKQANSENKPQYKFVAIILLLLHRIPEGFLIGFIISGIEKYGITSTSIAFLISLILHLIPEQILFYYRQREIGWSRRKSLVVSSLCLLLFLPSMLIGAYGGSGIHQIWELKGIVQSFMAGIFIFISILEFLPEFYHAHHNKKIAKFAIILFMVGLIFAAFVLSFHQHGQGV
ncbi:ZIP family metal transporter [Mycoplasma tauri]|uniref:ZIP family metal transporter n=1 Tax=Mycoplasma tauri TaxID=547987 RepID=UPI001CBED5D4|nr:ZIP family metal transporter [Mycoplasma tauri]MBZ4203378.1 ZIP family metal transporter [Mycoplasma tauri]MBZ4218043.1 ZIP family metal transporter [Mycoplasma tauri]MBZ4226611.1 ZIP family metal transporter [Mycoplasma tauri]